MTVIRTKYTGDLHCEAEHLDSGSKIRTVAPKDNNGDGSLFSPTDLFATSLGCCMLTIIGMAAKTNGFSIDGTTVTTEKIMAANPRRVAELHLDIKFPEGSCYTDKQKAMIENAAKTCPVANSISPEIKKIVNFIYD
ncbi:MAG: OsmC family protein [Bacteroidales bacterium]|nr:OsmC family protein [Candidatus Cacconaster equi]